MGPLVVFCLTLLTPLLHIKANPLGHSQLLGQTNSFVGQTQTVAYETHETEEFTQTGQFVNSKSNTEASGVTQHISNTQEEAIKQKDKIESDNAQGLERTAVNKEVHENQHSSHFERRTALHEDSRNINSHANNFENTRNLNRQSKTDETKQLSATNNLSSERSEIHKTQSARNVENIHNERRTEIDKVSKKKILKENDNFQQLQRLQQSRNEKENFQQLQRFQESRNEKENVLKSQQSLTQVTDNVSTDSITNDKEINKQTESVITNVNDQSTGYIKNDDYSADHISQTTSPNNNINANNFAQSTSVAKNNNIYKDKSTNKDGARTAERYNQIGNFQNGYNIPRNYPQVDFEDVILVKLLRRLIRKELNSGNRVDQDIANCGSGFYNIGKYDNNPNSDSPLLINLVLPDDVLEMQEVIYENRGIDPSEPFPVYVKQCGDNQQIIVL